MELGQATRNVTDSDDVANAGDNVDQEDFVEDGDAPASAAAPSTVPAVAATKKPVPAASPAAKKPVASTVPSAAVRKPVVSTSTIGRK